MAWQSIIWNGNIAHVAEHGVSQDEVDFVLQNPTSHGVSRSTGEPILFGYTEARRYIAVVYFEVDEFTVYPVTAYDVKEPIE